MIIDSHIHLSEFSLALFNPNIEASVGKAIFDMDTAGIDKAAVLFLPDINDTKKLYKLVEKRLDRFIPFCSINLAKKNFSLQLEQLATNYAFKGIKLHPPMQKFAPYSENMFDLYEKAIELDMPIVFDGYSQSKDILLYNLHPYEYDKLAKRYPELKIVIAHAGGHKIWDAYFVARSNKNVYLDISLICHLFKNTSLISDLQVMLDLLDEKIIFGSDFPTVGITYYYNEIKKLMINIDLEKQEKIFCKNFLKLVVL